MVGLGAHLSRCLFVRFTVCHTSDDSYMLHSFRLGPVALATQSVLLVSSSTTFQAPFALGVATAVR